MARRVGAVSCRLWMCCILAAALPGCSEDFWLGKQRYLSAERTYGTVSPRNDYTDHEFYLVHVNQLQELRRPSSLTYLGSDAGFHYFQVWNKAGREREVQFVALRKTDCHVSGEASIDSEVAYRTAPFAVHPWRHALVENGACAVGPRTQPQSVTSGQ